MSTKNYSSINSIKEFAIDEIAPKYFNMEEVNDLNLGLLGYTTEMIGTVTEDAFNTITTYMNEIFPNLAIIPESIYNYGALFQIDSALAKASKCDVILFVPEEAIIKYATKVTNSTDLYEFYLDSDMVISIEDIRFRPDYDIKINYKKYRNDYIFTAMYDMTQYNGPYSNTISDITNPYIKLKRINFEHTKYLQLEIQTHQVDRYDINDNVVDSTIINLPKYTIEFDDYIANFEVFYKAPGSNSYTQLAKKMLGSSPSKEPFCYYKSIDDNRIEISFTSRDNFFQPDYNSEINISYFTTLGEAGNFVEYTGTSITVNPTSTEYDYNNGLTLFAIPLSGAYNGANPLTLDQLKNMVIEKFSTVGSYTNENDLQLYFDNFNYKFNSNILFIKKRDDIFERLFSAFILLKDNSGEIYSTNTLQLELTPDDFDEEFSQSDMYILKPGHLFKYKDSVLDAAEIIPNVRVEDYETIDEPFLYTNPFLIYFSKSPVGTSYYLTTVDDKYVVDYSYVNNNSLYQFICNKLSVTRNGFSGSDKYKILLSITPTTDLDNPMVIENKDENGNVTSTDITNSIKVRLIATDGNIDACYLDMKLESWDLDSNIYTFGCEIETDDYIMISNKFRVINMYDTSTNLIDGNHLIPMMDSILKVQTSYTDADGVTMLTNEYKTESNPITFIKPMQMIRSNSDYIYNGDGTVNSDGIIENGTYRIKIGSSPLLRASVLNNDTKARELYNIITTQYNYIDSILNVITNNYSIDLKFYNTYGKSKNFYIGDTGNILLNKVNISIKFKIHPVFGTVEDDLIRDVKIFIKDYIENINDSGTNTFYVSNLITELETNFKEIEYLKFMGINDYSTDIQAIVNLTTDLDTLTKSERINYVPEYLTLNLDDVIIEIF